jgi:hypothetical protein
MPEVLLDAAGRPRSPATCPATTPAERRATRASATPADHPGAGVFLVVPSRRLVCVRLDDRRQV